MTQQAIKFSANSELGTLVETARFTCSLTSYMQIGSPYMDGTYMLLNTQQNL